MSKSKIQLIKEEWGTLYLKSGTKAHIMDSCRYVNDSHRKVEAENFPENHIEICNWCENKFDEWRKGLDKDLKIRCERCGTRTNNATYCNDCQLHVERMRARK